MSVTAEGLGVTVNGAKEAEFGEWEGSLLPSGTEASIGNEEAVSPTQIKFLLLCPETTGGKLETHAKGRLHPAIENGVFSPFGGESGCVPGVSPDLIAG